MHVCAWRRHHRGSIISVKAFRLSLDPGLTWLLTGWSTEQAHSIRLRDERCVSAERFAGTDVQLSPLSTEWAFLRTPRVLARTVFHPFSGHLLFFSTSPSCFGGWGIWPEPSRRPRTISQLSCGRMTPKQQRDTYTLNSLCRVWLWKSLSPTWREGMRDFCCSETTPPEDWYLVWGLDSSHRMAPFTKLADCSNLTLHNNHFLPQSPAKTKIKIFHAGLIHAGKPQGSEDFFLLLFIYITKPE